MSATAHVDPSSASVAPGDEQHVVLRVRNSGDIVESYRLTVVGDASDWTTVEPETLSLYPGTEGSATLAFRPPRSSTVRAGELPYAVRVLPSERPDGVVVPEGVVEVLPFHELDAEVVPPQRKRRLRARFQVRVANLGNTPVPVRLAADEASEEVEHTLSTETLTLEPGEETHVDLVVRPRKLLWFGTAVQHPFEVRARRDGDGDEPPAVPSGTYVQQPILPYWLLALLALLIALLVLWFTLVLPTVRSAAREQADAAIEEATNASSLPSSPASGGADRQGAGPGGQPGGDGDSAGPGGDRGADGGTGQNGGAGQNGGTGGSARGGGGGDEFATVLETSVSPGGSDTEVFRVPDDRLLLITDIVASAPQGDTGTLRVSIDDRTVISLALENFRNHDNHWVTPVEAPPGSTIVMEVTCRKPGNPPNAPAPGTCAGSVFVNGASVPAPSGSPSARGR
ncbi:MAG TPA: hydrolytic protein [Streptomyces sp.]|uniref:COG1470 family protein n=1 Tax=Streptomyces sp. TaxID=1931 RepID=UPI002D569347|nr:hydrolytic protein [Streptomyces sp.]HZG02293.1 hydrolytic protein [Streptomyces sp.]